MPAWSDGHKTAGCVGQPLCGEAAVGPSGCTSSMPVGPYLTLSVRQWRGASAPPSHLRLHQHCQHGVVLALLVEQQGVGARPPVCHAGVVGHHLQCTSQPHPTYLTACWLGVTSRRRKKPED